MRRPRTPEPRQARVPTGRTLLDLALPCVLTVLILLLDDLEPGPQYVGLLVAPPLVAAALLGPALTAAVGASALAAGAAYGGYASFADTRAQWVRLLCIALAAVVAVGLSRARRRRERRLAEVTSVAEAAQQALLPDLPPGSGEYRLATRYVSAQAEATVGGDFFDVVDSDGGLRLIVGDVRGKGLPAVRLANVLLGSFREATWEGADLPQLVERLDRACRLSSGEEDFATAVVVDLGADGAATVVSCGHPHPLVLRSGRVEELDTVATTPLGLGAVGTPVPFRLDAGDQFLLYTDGLVEARDQHGTFFDLHTAFAAAKGALSARAGANGGELLDALFEAVRRHTGAPDLGDDVAVVLVARCPSPPLDQLNVRLPPGLRSATLRDGTHRPPAVRSRL
jgi:phosphoserine phosphatase RsbU/P